MQSTGQTSTHAASLVPMHGSVMTKGMTTPFRRPACSAAATRHPTVSCGNRTSGADVLVLVRGLEGALILQRNVRCVPEGARGVQRPVRILEERARHHDHICLTGAEDV